jgi:hypothetical protein
MKNEQVPARQLKSKRKHRFVELMESGKSEAEALAFIESKFELVALPCVL